MWLLVLILSIKLQMPTWYWILFTVWSMVKYVFVKTLVDKTSK